MLPRFYSVLLLVVTIITAPICFAIACLIWCLSLRWDNRLIYLHYFTSLWAKMLISVPPCWQSKIIHPERFPTDKPYIIVSNHQSGVDILLAFGLFKPFKWLSKIEIFRLPFIGWNMRLNQYIALNRGDRKSVAKMSAQVRHHLTQGSSVYIFPEGSRSKDGKVRSFKNGAFKLAKECGVGIIPIALHGTAQALPKNSLKLGQAKMTLEVLPAIEAQEVAATPPQQLNQLVHKKISQAIHKIQTNTVKG
ncbi:lysophospholipid acyltransferase family protein [Celerinatantimonas yamalensis]|uniref:1-acyl-sn-glycerol-3-phosphate acyltransferase n=1 Tax=Celerinatantimonas yamalensis TaxID=559956 RepID=A0ABW9G949_9GAMM